MDQPDDDFQYHENKRKNDQPPRWLELLLKSPVIAALIAGLFCFSITIVITATVDVNELLENDGETATLITQVESSTPMIITATSEPQRETPTEPSIAITTLTDNVPTQTPIVVTATINNVPTQSNVATSTPNTVIDDVATMCPGLTHTGMSTEITVELSVPENYVQYLWGSGFDDFEYGILLIKITGPYSGSHELYEGGFCEPVPSDTTSDQLTFEQVQRELGMREPTNIIELPQ